MKITKQRLEKIINEEIEKELNEFNAYHVAAAVGARNNRQRSTTKSKPSYRSPYESGVLGDLESLGDRIRFAVKYKDFSLEKKLEVIKDSKDRIEAIETYSEEAKKKKEEYIQLADKMGKLVITRSQRGQTLSGKLKNWWQEFTKGSQKPDDWDE